MAVPKIDLLPDPPLPTDSEADFDAKAGASLTAQQQMVPQINASLTWVGQQVAAVGTYATAASDSAAASAASAAAANQAKAAAQQAVVDAGAAGAQQVQLAAEQVSLASDQVDSAQSAASSAQAYAAAAGSAAGLPALNGAGNFLTINATNDGVAFSSPLALLHATALLF
jgi:hypothetical protein